MAPDAPTASAIGEPKAYEVTLEETRHEVDREEARGPVVALDDRAEHPQRPAVEQDVEEAGVQEHRRDQAPVLSVNRDRRRV
jgi:hypothetical protein